MKAFVFDTETTGLVKNSLIPLQHQPRIIELYGEVVEDDGTVLQEIEFFADPGIPLDPIITRITGITPQDLIGAQPFRVHAPQLCEALRTCDAVVAHNLSFDMALVEADCLRCNALVPWPARKICTVEETEWIKGHRLSLSDLHEHLFGEKFAGAHRARVDVKALTRCYLELRKRGDL